MNLKICMILWVFALMQCKNQERDGIVIDENSCSNYSEFIEMIEKSKCEGKNIVIRLPNNYPIQILNRCPASMRISCGNTLSISYDQYSRARFDMPNELMSVLMEEFIMNPERRVDMAENPEKAPLFLRFKNETSTSKVFTELEILSKIHKDISQRFDLKGPLLIKFVSEKHLPLPPPIK